MKNEKDQLAEAITALLEWLKSSNEHKLCPAEQQLLKSLLSRTKSQAIKLEALDAKTK